MFCVHIYAYIIYIYIIYIYLFICSSMAPAGSLE